MSVYICHHRDPINGTRCKSTGMEEQACPYALKFYRDTVLLMEQHEMRKAEKSYASDNEHDAVVDELCRRMNHVHGRAVYPTDKPMEGL